MQTDFYTSRLGQLLYFINNPTAAIGVSQVYTEDLKTLILQYFQHWFAAVDSNQLIKKCLALEVLRAIGSLRLWISAGHGLVIVRFGLQQALNSF
jgi:hypothetical protein